MPMMSSSNSAMGGADEVSMEKLVSVLYSAPQGPRQGHQMDQEGNQNNNNYVAQKQSDVSSDLLAQMLAKLPPSGPLPKSAIPPILTPQVAGKTFVPDHFDNNTSNIQTIQSKMNHFAPQQQQRQQMPNYPTVDSDSLAATLVFSNQEKFIGDQDDKMKLTESYVDIPVTHQQLHQGPRSTSSGSGGNEVPTSGQKRKKNSNSSKRKETEYTSEEETKKMEVMEACLQQSYVERKKRRENLQGKDLLSPFLDTDAGSTKRKRRKPTRKNSNCSLNEGAKAFRYPPDKPFAVGLELPLVSCLAEGGPELDTIKTQKLVDATKLLQDTGQHVLEPLTLYTKNELYELMASIAEAWKNSGKAAWKKRINKIRENARYRKAPRNGLDEKDLQEIAELQQKIQEREEWEKREKLKIRLARSTKDSSSSVKSERR